MVFRSYYKFRARKFFRQFGNNFSHQVKLLARHLNVHLLQKWDGMREIRRFIFSWLLLAVLLTTAILVQTGTLKRAYMVDAPAPGGTFTEGVVGEFSNLNPLFANTGIDSAASRLIFSSLLKYDKEGQLTTDMAESWKVGEKGQVYTVKLKEGIKWHDGKPLTAKDVKYTFEIVQREETGSSLRVNWKNIKIEAVDDHTVVFTLPNAFTPFPHSLTTGIVPAHLLQDIEPSSLRPAEFNQAPVGSGPFKFVNLNTVAGKLELTRNEDYHGGDVQLSRFVLRSYETVNEMKIDFEESELTGMGGVDDFTIRNSVPLKRGDTYDLPMFSNVYAFFNNSRPVLNEKPVRQALVKSVNNSKLAVETKLRYSMANSALVVGQVGYDPATPQLEFDFASAEVTLDQNGWVKGPDGIRQKDGQRLAFTIHSQNNNEYPVVARFLEKSWEQLGAEVDVVLLKPSDLQSKHIVTHDYDVLLIGITIGADPDIFVYWHQSQAVESGFNFSEYKSAEADEALEAGRTRSDNDLRAAKYKTFLQTWRDNAPAVALYRPTYVYVQALQVSGFEPPVIASPADRYLAVEDWTVLTEKAPREEPLSVQ